MPPSFAFAIPSLPRPIYECLKAMAKEHGVSQWHIVIAGVLTLQRLRDQAFREDISPNTHQHLIDHVRATY